MEILSHNQEPEKIQLNFEFLNKYHRNDENSPLKKNWKKLKKQLENGEGETDYLKAYEKMTDPEIVMNDFPVSGDKIGMFLVRHFDRDDLKMGLIDRIDLDGSTVILMLPKDNDLHIDADQYFVPSEEFSSMWDRWDRDTRDKISQFVHRGHSQSHWYTEKYTEGKFIRMPILISNQNYDVQNRAIVENKDLKEFGIDYLEELPIEQRREQYILGTLSHEIGHTWYTYIIERNPSVEVEWKKYIDKYGNLTGYAQMYEDRNPNHTKDYNENFAEAVRLMTTCPKYLEKNGKKEVVDFIKSIFDIK